MNILAMDTSGPVAGCCVMSDGKVRHLIAIEHGLTHSETVMPAVEAAMSASGLTCKDIDVFAVVAGPGSFTGVRLGVCAAKGLAHAAGKPCAPVHALEALAMNLAGFDGIVCPILDARRGQVYCAAFDVSTGKPLRMLEDDAVALEEFISRMPEERRIAFVGDGVAVNEKKILAILGDRAFIPPVNLRSLRADAVCEIARMNEDKWVPAHELTPVYLRKPQAERERMEKMNNASV